MQGIPKAPSAMPSRAPHVKHVPGTLLQPPQPLSSDDDHLYDDELIAAPPIPITAHQNKNNKRGHVPQSTDRSSSKLRQPSPIQAIHSLPIMRPVSQRPSRETFGVTETAEVLHVHGDPFPPCFRVVGVSQESVETTRISPTNIHNDSMGGYNTSQLHLLHDTQSGDRGLNASNTRSSESSQPAPSDKKGDDDENVANTKTRKSYLQMSFGWAYPRRPAESTREIFEDEEEAVQVDTSEDKDSEPETSLSIAESQMSTTQSYLALTKQLMQQRKARERRQLEKQQQQQKQNLCQPCNSSSNFQSADPQQAFKCDFGVALLENRRWRLWLCLIFALAMGCILLLVIATQLDLFTSSNTTAASIAQQQVQQQGDGVNLKPTTSDDAAFFDLVNNSDDTLGPLDLSDFPAATQATLALNNPTTPQVLAYEWLLNDPNIDTLPKWRQVQRMALATFYYSTNGPTNWKSQASNWMSYSLSECQWYSQACDANGKIRQLLASDLGLHGTLPIEFFWLTTLQQMQLSDNPNLVGELPSEIGQLKELQVLWLQNCGLTASPDSATALPTELGQLGSTLLYLDVTRNPLGRLGTFSNDDRASIHNDIPSELGLLTNLQELILSKADLIGSLPTEIGELSSLQYSLQLQGNKLIGTLPSELGKLTLLEHFYAEENNFTGTLPSELGAWTKIKIMDLSVSHLEGTLPASWGIQLESLQELWLYDNLFSSSISEQWGMLSETLVSLDISMNQLDSSLPTELFSLTGATGLWLYQNQLTGLIPSEIGNLHDKLLQLSLFGNRLVGSLPSEMSRLSNLRGLWLDGNQLTGSIPAGLLRSTSMISLHLFNNQLGGSLPIFPRDPYYAMQDLRLDQNLLTGSIPVSLRNLSVNLQFLRLEQNELTGEIPSALAELTKLESLNVQHNEISGVVPWQLCSLKQSLAERLSIVVDCEEVACDCDCTC